MSRWSSRLFIAAYLGALCFGLMAHALKFLTTSHPAMYFVVWDMYCGWSAYETRVHVVGQGESGRYYQLSPSPWGDFKPYQVCDRLSYDTEGTFAPRLAANVLSHTTHEPILRTYVIEENWAKKYNLPDAQWQVRFSEPKAPYSYYSVRTTVNDQGELTQATNTWLRNQYYLSVLDNTRLQQGVAQKQRFVSTEFPQRLSTESSGEIIPASYETPDGQ
ncbi:MAG: hypothetical protein R3C01_08265 [Planctomycetaceae bacterium]